MWGKQLLRRLVRSCTLHIALWHWWLCVRGTYIWIIWLCHGLGAVGPVDGGVHWVVMVATGEDPAAADEVEIEKDPKQTCHGQQEAPVWEGRTGEPCASFSQQLIIIGFLIHLVRIWFSSLLNSCLRLGYSGGMVSTMEGYLQKQSLSSNLINSQYELCLI